MADIARLALLYNTPPATVRSWPQWMVDWLLVFEAGRTHG